MHNQAPDLLRILQQYKTIAVVGMSPEPLRPSHYVSLYMQQHGYRVIPVNPRYTAGTLLLGEPCYATLADIPHPIDMVNVFRRTEDVLPFAQQAIAIGAKCLWQQLGIANLEADQLVRAAGLDSVYNRCLKIEHARLLTS